MRQVCTGTFILLTVLLLFHRFYRRHNATTLFVRSCDPLNPDCHNTTLHVGQSTNIEDQSPQLPDLNGTVEPVAQTPRVVILPRHLNAGTAPTFLANPFGRTPGEEDDLCVAMISFSGHHKLLSQLRNSWLSGVKSFLYSNKKAGGITVIPDHPGKMHQDYSGNNPGDYRWVFSVHHANTSCRPFKWLLVADDDTYMVTSSLRSLLTGLDHNMPWYLGWPHPPTHGRASHCLGGKKRKEAEDPFCCGDVSEPCWIKNMSKWAAAETPCPISPYKGLDNVFARAKKNATWQQPLAPFWHYGGAGAIVSVGLLDRIAADDFLSCGQRTVCAGGDRRLGSCLGLHGGVGITNFVWAGLSDGGFVNPAKALRKYTTFHRINPRQAQAAFQAEKARVSRRGPVKPWRPPEGG
eukprot:TRINITY_DN87621_c0_g1_i1.p1 TRINITY_DN87621_c0_g1~~TRINITY_DN87621_c0_g1_i1.p1  ORF type:complete len:407 (+),score=26.95 TRINITY_DN87621_c0_g1_i1:58-1278(+)